jgi:hypothetical protein
MVDQPDRPDIWLLNVTYNQRLDETGMPAALAALPASVARRLKLLNMVNRSAPAGAAGVEREVHCGRVVAREIETAGNGGLAGGYNLGLDRIRPRPGDHILLLNSDSAIDELFLADVFTRLDQQRSGSCATIGYCPTLVSAGRQVSPFRCTGFDHDFYIIAYLCLDAAFFAGGRRFPDRYWLDGIDYWLSAELQAAGLQPSLLPHRIGHDLSVVDHFVSLPRWRYANIIASVVNFYADLQRPRLATCYVLARAVARCLRFRRFDLVGIPAGQMLRQLVP